MKAGVFVEVRDGGNGGNIGGLTITPRHSIVNRRLEALASVR